MWRRYRKGLSGRNPGTCFCDGCSRPAAESLACQLEALGSLENVGEWIQAGCVAVGGVDGSLTAGAKTGDLKSIIEMSRQFVAGSAARDLSG